MVLLLITHAGMGLVVDLGYMLHFAMWIEIEGLKELLFYHDKNASSGISELNCSSNKSL